MFFSCVHTSRSLQPVPPSAGNTPFPLCKWKPRAVGVLNGRLNDQVTGHLSALRVGAGIFYLLSGFDFIQRLSFNL